MMSGSFLKVKRLERKTETKQTFDAIVRRRILTGNYQLLVLVSLIGQATTITRYFQRLLEQLLHNLYNPIQQCNVGVTGM